MNLIDRHGKVHNVDIEPAILPVNYNAKSIVNSYVAGTDLNSNSLVMLWRGTVIYYDTTDSDNYYKLLGFTKTSVRAGHLVDIIEDGLVTNPGWGLVQDDTYYAGDGGTITNIPPTSGTSTLVGIAFDSNNLKVNLSEQVVLAQS